MTVGGDRHHDDIALAPGRLDMPDVAEMHDVEHTVAERDLQPSRLRRTGDVAQFLDRPYLLMRLELAGRRRVAGCEVMHVTCPNHQSIPDSR